MPEEKGKSTKAKLELKFIKYDFNKHKLVFDIITDQAGCNDEYYLKCRLLERIPLHCHAQISIESNKVTISKLKGKSHIEFLLMHIKKPCDDFGVKNWQEFSEKIKLECKIHSQLNNQYNYLSKLPKDILHLIASKYIGVFARPAMMKINKEIHDKINNPEQILKMHYPDAYQAEKKANSGKVNNKRHYHQLFVDSYTDEAKKNTLFYPGVKSPGLRLSVLFKHGDLPAIIQLGTTIRNIENSDFHLLYSAYRNGHNHILDYFYHLDTPEMNSLYKAIHCFQDIETLSAALQEVGDINNTTPTPGQYLTPLMLAAKMNNFAAVKFLCQQPGIDLNRRLYGSKTALDYALYNDNLEMVKYFCDPQELYPKLYFPDVSYGTRFMKDIGTECARYLFEHPAFALELLQASDLCDGLEYRSQVAVFYQNKINNWLINNKEANNPLLAPVVKYLDVHCCESLEVYYRAIFALIIKQSEQSSPEIMLQLIEKIQRWQDEKYQADSLLRATLAELKDNFKQPAMLAKLRPL